MKASTEKENLKYINYTSYLLQQLYMVLTIGLETKKYKRADKLYGIRKRNFRESVEYTKTQLMLLEDAEEIIRAFNAVNRNSELLEYLEDEYEKYSKVLQLRDKEFEHVINQFDKETKKAFKILKEGNPDFSLLSKAGKVYIPVEETGSYCVNLVFETLHDISEYEDIIICDFELIKDESGYIFDLMFEDMETQEMHMLKIPFTKAYIEMQLFDYTRESVFWDSNPWVFLSDILMELKYKADWELKYLNDKEKELVALVGFYPFASFIFQREINYDVSDNAYRLLKKYVEESDNINLLLLLNEIHNKKCEKKQKKLCIEFKRQLSEPKSNRFWRVIMKDFANACSEYPSKSEVYSDKEKLYSIRNCIQKYMNQQGVEGIYPNFFIKEKREKEEIILSYIKIGENAWRNNYNSNFCIGTVRCKEERAYIYKDMYDIWFENKKIKDVKINAVQADLLLSNEKSDKEVKRMCKIVAKAARLQKLTKEEEKYMHIFYNKSSETGVLASVCAIGGMFFGILFAAAMAILEFVITLIFTGDSFVKSISRVMEISWWFVALGAGGGFGILLFIVFFIKSKQE